MANLTLTFDGRVPTILWDKRVPYPSSYSVYWSPGPNGPWVGLNQTPILVNQWTDIDHPIRSENRIYYKVNYIVGATELPHVTATNFNRSASPAWLNRVLNEIKRRHENIMLGTIGGESCDLYLRRAAGTICPHGEVVGDGYRCSFAGEICPVCFGTGLIGGYVLESGVKIRVKNAQEQAEITATGIQISAGRSGYMGAYPLVETGDFFMRPSGERFAITNVRRRELQGRRTLQTFNLNLIEPEHPMFDITSTSLASAIG